MKNYGKVRSADYPKEIEITSAKVFIASNITNYHSEIEGKTIDEYQYDYVEYSKDEYIALISKENSDLQKQILETQIALCDIYESINGGGL